MGKTQIPYPINFIFDSPSFFLRDENTHDYHFFKKEKQFNCFFLCHLKKKGILIGEIYLKKKRAVFNLCSFILFETFIFRVIITHLYFFWNFLKVSIKVQKTKYTIFMC